MYQELMSHCEEPNTSLPSLWNFCLKSRCVESKNMQGPFSSPLPSSKCSRLRQGISKFLSAFRTRNISFPSWQIEMLGLGWIFHVDPHYMHPESWGDAGNSPDDSSLCVLFFSLGKSLDVLITRSLGKKKKVFFFLIFDWKPHNPAKHTPTPTKNPPDCSGPSHQPQSTFTPKLNPSICIKIQDTELSCLPILEQNSCLHGNPHFPLFSSFYFFFFSVQKLEYQGMEQCKGWGKSTHCKAPELQEGCILFFWRGAVCMGYILGLLLRPILPWTWADLKIACLW